MAMAIGIGIGIGIARARARARAITTTITIKVNLPVQQFQNHFPKPINESTCHIFDQEFTSED